MCFAAGEAALLPALAVQTFFSPLQPADVKGSSGLGELALSVGQQLGGAQHWLEVMEQGHSSLARASVQGEHLAKLLYEESVARVGVVWSD